MPVETTEAQAAATLPPGLGAVPGPDVTRLLEVAWAQPAAHDVLQAIAEGVTEVLGFGVAAVSVVREASTVEVVAVAGDESARAALLGTHTPLADLRLELAVADEWGALRFVPHDPALPAPVAGGWVPDVEVADHPDAWHPLDLLLAPLLDAAGTLRGLLSVDLPADGRRPDLETRAQLERYAAQAARALVAALEREALHEKVRLAAATRTIVRAASARLDLPSIVRQCQHAIFDGLRVGGSWLTVFEPDCPADEGADGAEGAAGPGWGLPRGLVLRDSEVVVDLPDDLVRLTREAAEVAWREQTVVVVSPRRPPTGLVTAEQHARVLEHLARTGVASIMFVPLGAGPECLGALVLTRWEVAHDWTDVEAAAALDIGHDLGRAVLNARLFERERRLVAELQAVDHYRAQLVSTVAHELRTPLTAIVGHSELALDRDDLDARSRDTLTAVHRSAARIDGLVRDLLALTRASDPQAEVERLPVDLRAVVEDVHDLLGLAAAEQGVELVVEGDADVMVPGDATLLDRLVQNLVGNAVKYSPGGGRVTVSLARDGDEVVLAVGDEGIGIAADELDRLFGEFWRSRDPAARAQPGTGLGLAIVERIVARHGGQVAVASQPGRGSTFTVRLPATA